MREVSFESMYEQYDVPLKRHIYYIVFDYGAAEEIVQETFLQAYRNSEYLRRADTLGIERWLYRVAINKAIDYLRRKKLIAWEYLPDFRRALVDLEGTDPHEVYQQHEKQRWVRTALVHMQEKERVPLLLYEIEGLSVQEIARILVLTEGAVKMRLIRGRISFRRLYQQFADG